MEYIRNNEFLKIYLIAVNIITFCAFTVDKQRAIHGKWRIREKTLLTLSVIGGSVGGLLAMYTFRHKTKHAKFVYGLPFILLVQMIILYAV